MSIDTSITRSAGQILVFSVGDMEVRLRVAILLSKAEINDVDLISTLSNAHEEVIGFDITMDERFGVNVLDTRDELIGKEEHRLERELPVAEVEEILQTWSEQIKDHGIVVAFGTKPTDKWNSNSSS